MEKDLSLTNKDQIIQATKQMRADEQSDIAAETLKDLSPEKKNETIQKAGGLDTPDKRITNVIWLIVILGFTSVFVLTSLFLIYGVVFLQRKADTLQIMLIIFNTVVGFLGGLFTPSPVHSTGSSSQS